ncbi:DUF4113 domain-containing protein [Pontibacter litorisediminis]
MHGIGKGPWPLRQENLSPCYTTRLGDPPEVQVKQNRLRRMRK